MKYEPATNQLRRLGDNEELLIQMVAGGSFIPERDDEITHSDQGILVVGTDDHQTRTYIPWASVAFIRSFTKTRKRMEADEAVEEFARRHDATKKQARRFIAEQKLIDLGFIPHDDPPKDCNCAACTKLRELLAERENGD
jgi:hypothetical protein